MSVIAPTILAEEPTAYEAIIKRYHAFAQRVHIDLTDGEFAPNITVSDDQIWWPKEWQADIHAMVARPEEHVDALIALQPHMIIFHAEVETDLLPVTQKIQAAGIKAGVALLRPTVPSSIQSLITQADHVMIFSGTLGHYGGTASMMQLEKVRLLKQINPALEIGWDGGVTVENAYTLVQGGIDVLNVGGTLSRSETPDDVYAKLVAETNKHGVL